MSKKKDIWNQITSILEAKLSKSDFETWFSQTSLKEFNSNLAIIEVPNKFFSSWLQDKYLPDIKRSFKKIVGKTPEIDFIYHHPLSTLNHPISESTLPPFLPSYLQTGPWQGSKLEICHDLNPSMTFQNFITGDYNRFAYASALEVASKPAYQYNPLYIFSKFSLGKTHLLNAIGHHILHTHPYYRIKYLSADSFTLDFSYSIKNRKLHEFRNKYYHIDLLLLDDVQLLANRRRSQEELLLIFNTLYGEKKQIVITGDKPPNKLNHINPQLRSRLEWGLLSEIKTPDHNAKIDIIKKKLKEDNIPIPEDVIFYLAKSNSDFKMILRNLARIETYASLNKKEINISMIKSLIKNNNRIQPGIEEIKSIISSFFNISVSELISNKKQRYYSYPRQLAMYLCRKYTNRSFKEIGESFGQRNHSTVIHAIRRIENYKNQKKEEILDDLNKIEKLLK